MVLQQAEPLAALQSPFGGALTDRDTSANLPQQ